MEIHIRTTGCRLTYLDISLDISHNVTCHPTQANAPRLNPSRFGTQFTYLGMEG